MGATVEKEREYNSLRSGITVKERHVCCTLSTKDQVYTIGLMPSQVNGGLGYALYSFLGWEWKEDDETLFRLDNIYSGETLWFTGRELDMFHNYRLPKKPNDRIKEYFNRLALDIKAHKDTPENGNGLRKRN